MASGDQRRPKPFQKKCPLKDPCKTLRKVVNLLEHPISRDLSERQRELLNDFLEATQYAFWLRDVPYLIRLFEAITKTVDKINFFNDEIEKLLLFCAVPPMLTKSSDKLEYERDFQEYFSMLGYFTICLREEHLSGLVLDAILGLLQRSGPVGYCCASLEFCQESASKSHLPEITGQLLEVMDDSLYGKLLEINILLADISNEACGKILMQNALEYLICRLDSKWRERNLEQPLNLPILQESISNPESTLKLLWLLLNSLEENRIHIEKLTIFALRSLQSALRLLTTSLISRVNRNDLMGIILNILKHLKDLDLIESNLGEDIASLSILTEQCPDEEHWTLSVKFSPNDEDALFKKLLLASLIYFENHGAVELLEKCKIVKGLVKILKRKSKINWHPDYHCDFIMTVTRIFPKIIPQSIEQLLLTQAPLEILKLVESFFHQRYNMNLLFNSIHCLNEFIRLNNENIKIMIVSNNGFNIILTLCSHLLCTNILTKINQFVLGRGFLFLYSLCDKEKDNNQEIMELISIFLKRLFKPSDDDPMMGTKVSICAILFAWKVVKTCEQNCQNFVKDGGIYLLLDIVQFCTFPVKTVTLGALVDIIKKGEGIPHFITWRESGQGLLSMLMEVFRGENHYCLSFNESEFPATKSKQNRHLALCNERASYLLITRKQMVSSCRLKIYKILKTLTQTYRDEVEIANDHYKLFPEDLTVEDEVTLLFAKNYLSLKLCEAWMDMYQKLNEEQVDITEDDREDLEISEKLIHNWTHYLQRRGEEILSTELEKEEISELHIYQTLKESKLTEALEGLKEMIYVSKCTEKMFQMRRKLIQSHEIDVCIRNKCESSTNHHRTTKDVVKILNIFNQTVSIQSDIMPKKDEELIDFLPVSNMESEVDFNLNEPDDLVYLDENLSCN